MEKSKITKMVAGKEVDVPIDEAWDAICRILRLARLCTAPGVDQGKYLEARLCFLSERLNDIEGLHFNYKSRAFSGNNSEEFVPLRKN